MSNILAPPKRKGDIQRLLENIFGPNIIRPQPEFTLSPDPTRPYTLEWEDEEINKLLFLEGHDKTSEDLTNQSLQKMLNIVRSKKYQEGQ